MQGNRSLSALGLTALCLTFSSVFTMLFLGWLAYAMPGSLGSRLSDQLVQLIGHSGQRWLLSSLAAFTVPAGVTITLLQRSRLREALLRVSGFVSVIAMPVCYWPWRRHDLSDVIPLLLSLADIPLIVTHASGKWILTRRDGVIATLLYFGVFAWLFAKVIYVPEVLLVPACALVSTIAWAYDIKKAASA